MSIIEFKQTSDYNVESSTETYPVETVNIQTDAETLPDVLDAFERFLRGAGYVFDGKVEIVNDKIKAPGDDYP